MRTVGKHELFTMTQCPANFSVGYRTTPGQLIPDYVGNTCEPWIARFALILLDRLLDAGAGTAPPNLAPEFLGHARPRGAILCWLSYTLALAI